MRTGARRAVLPCALWRAIALGYIGLGMSGALAFTVWPQILDHPRIDLWELDPIGDAHALRYALMLPVLNVADVTGWDVHRVFTVEVCLLVVAIPILLDRSRIYITGDAGPAGGHRLTFGLVFIILSFFMNGRMVFGLCGATLVIWGQAKWHVRRMPTWRLFLTFVAGLWLGSVSTGVFNVVVGAIFLWAVFCLLRTFPWVSLRTIVMMGPLLLLLVLMTPLVGAYAAKNLAYYSGSSLSETLWNMLGHGTGVWVQDAVLWEGPIVPAAVMTATAGVLLLLVVAAVRYPSMAPLFVSLLCSVAGGIFGYSTLTTGIPSVVVLMSVLTSPRSAGVA